MTTDQDFYTTVRSEAASHRRQDMADGGDSISQQYKTLSIFSKPVDYKRASDVLKQIEDKVYCGGLPRAGTY